MLIGRQRRANDGGTEARRGRAAGVARDPDTRVRSTSSTVSPTGSRRNGSRSSRGATRGNGASTPASCRTFPRRRARCASPTGASAPIPADLLDRRVEITGPPERKMVINALNSGANVFMADFEDSLCPTWGNLIEGQANLVGAVRRTLTHASPEGKQYRLEEKTAVLVVRPRGWHLPEKHWLQGDEPIAGAFMDFGLYLHHNAAELAAARHRAVLLPAEARETDSRRGSGRASSSTPRRRSACRAGPSRSRC